MPGQCRAPSETRGVPKPAPEDSADALRQPNAAPTSKRISWSHSRKRYTVRHGPYRYGELVRTRWSNIRSKFPAVSAKASGSVCAVRVKPARAEEKAAIF